MSPRLNQRLKNKGGEKLANKWLSNESNNNKKKAYHIPDRCFSFLKVNVELTLLLQFTLGKRRIRCVLPAGILELLFFLGLGSFSSSSTVGSGAHSVMPCHKYRDDREQVFRKFSCFTTFGTDICTEYHEPSPILFKDPLHKLGSKSTQSVLIKKLVK